MEIHINMQGWYAVIVGDKCLGAFVEYEDALIYKRLLQEQGNEVVVEKITHYRG